MTCQRASSVDFLLDFFSGRLSVRLTDCAKDISTRSIPQRLFRFIASWKSVVTSRTFRFSPVSNFPPKWSFLSLVFCRRGVHAAATNSVTVVVTYRLRLRNFTQIEPGAPDYSDRVHLFCIGSLNQLRINFDGMSWKLIKRSTADFFNPNPSCN